MKLILDKSLHTINYISLSFQRKLLVILQYLLIFWY